MPADLGRVPVPYKSHRKTTEDLPWILWRAVRQHGLQEQFSAAQHATQINPCWLIRIECPVTLLFDETSAMMAMPAVMTSARQKLVQELFLMVSNRSDDDFVIDQARDLANPAKKEQAAAALWNKYHQRLESLIAMNLDQRLRARVATSSVAQEAWRSFYSELEAGRAEFRDLGGVFALLWDIARKKLISRVRRVTGAGRDLNREQDVADREFEARTVEPLAQLIAKEAIESFDEEDEELRDVLELMLHGFKAKVIAQHLGISEPAVRRRIERIRARFRAIKSDED